MRHGRVRITARRHWGKFLPTGHCHSEEDWEKWSRGELAPFVPYAAPAVRGRNGFRRQLPWRDFVRARDLGAMARVRPGMVLDIVARIMEVAILRRASIWRQIREVSVRVRSEGMKAEMRSVNLGISVRGWAMQMNQRVPIHDAIKAVSDNVAPGSSILRRAGKLSSLWLNVKSNERSRLFGYYALDGDAPWSH